MPPESTKPRVRTRKGLLYDGAADSPAKRQAGKRLLRKGQVLGVLRSDGPLSRVEIARTLNFNLRSVSLLVDGLVAEGLAVELEGRPTASGRPPTPVALNARAACVLGIDVGRSTTAAAILDLQGNELMRTERESTFSADAAEQARWVESFINEFLRGRRGTLPPLAGVAIAAEGLVHRQQLIHRYAAATEPVRRCLETRLKVPVIAGEDSLFLALGEQWFGQARGAKNAAVFNLTDGLGLCTFIDGKPMAGSRGWANQIGHLPLGENGIPCFCGSTSCLENIVSGSGLVRMAQASGPLSERCATVHDLATMARSGSRPAVRIFERFAKGLALAVTIAVDLYDPEVVVIGGRLAGLSDLFLPVMNEELDRLAVPYIREATRIGVSDMGDDAILRGACAAVLNQIYETSHVTLETLL